MITKETTDLSNINFQSGEAILIDKPFKWTSFQVIYKIRRTINVKKVGHAGTLDPLATGLLIICTGKKTKKISKFQELYKTYIGTILLGKRSASMDLETELIGVDDIFNITDEKIMEAKERFRGKILQVPPMYSAVKLNGKTLYKLARKGKSVKREPREVVIKKFEIKKIEFPEVHFEIECSKGTYIRVIADDFGNTLGCGGVLSSLRRTKIGDYSVENALNIDDFTDKFTLSISEKN
ncbi:MAG: tRNA pseudouridine(55) synthase TruB [Ignavibacteriaceae bacterium]